MYSLPSVHRQQHSNCFGQYCTSVVYLCFPLDREARHTQCPYRLANHVTCYGTHSVYSLSPIIPILRPKSTIQPFSYHQNSLQFYTKQSIAMRLLHAESIQLRSFEENAIPRYAILSHTWGEDEVSLQDLHGSAAASKTGYQKIKYICEHALAQRLQYVWVDTCCIDKTSSAELSEAINSMFRWYRDAAYCYAYLADVPDPVDVTGTDLEQPASAFHSSRWFTRGWTLQELLAPANLIFFSSGGRRIGTKLELSEDISSITSIDEEYLTRNQPLSQASIAKRMSWVSRRKTTRTEDLAYCLLGIFDISMPLLYGEGDKAFLRLQEEIMKNSGDQSLFAWGYNDVDLHSYEGLLSSETSHGPFAEHPAQFMHSGHIIPDELEPPTSAFTLTNMGLQMNIRIVERLSRFRCPVAVLACRPENRWLWLIGIALRSHSEDSFTRLGLNTRLLLRRDEAADSPYRPVRFLTNPLHLRPPPPRPIANKYSCIIRKVPNHLASGGLSIWNVDPHDVWEPDQRILSLSENDDRHIVLRLWRQKGDGYVIVLERPPNFGTKIRQWRYAVYRENCDRPRSYNSYSKHWRDGIKQSITKKIEVYEGKEFIQTKESSTIIRIIDIELANAEAVPVFESGELLKKIGIGSQSRTEMAPLRARHDIYSDSVLFI